MYPNSPATLSQNSARTPPHSKKPFQTPTIQTDFPAIGFVPSKPASRVRIPAHPLAPIFFLIYRVIYHGKAILGIRWRLSLGRLRLRAPRTPLRTRRNPPRPPLAPQRRSQARLPIDEGNAGAFERHVPRQRRQRLSNLAAARRRRADRIRPEGRQAHLPPYQGRREGARKRGG